jgi:hypothetical protein
VKLRQQLEFLHGHLLKGGFINEAECIKEILAHYVPEGGNAPEFFRRNYDYGEGLYHGDMSDKGSVKDFLKEHHEKGPNWPKKKKKQEKP